MFHHTVEESRFARNNVLRVAPFYGVPLVPADRFESIVTHSMGYERSQVGQGSIADEGS